MAKISNKQKYLAKPDIKEEDYVIGSEETSKGTKNFLFSDIGNFIKSFLSRSQIKSSQFGFHLLGFNKDGDAVTIPVEDFQGSLVGNLQGDYYGETITSNTFKEQDYI